MTQQDNTQHSAVIAPSVEERYMSFSAAIGDIGERFAVADTPSTSQMAVSSLIELMQSTVSDPQFMDVNQEVSDVLSCLQEVQIYKKTRCDVYHALNELNAHVHSILEDEMVKKVAAKEAAKNELSSQLRSAFTSWLEEADNLAGVLLANGLRPNTLVLEFIPGHKCTPTIECEFSV